MELRGKMMLKVTGILYIIFAVLSMLGGLLAMLGGGLFALGGIGATTCLFPALTLGCGAVGGSSSSNNIGPLDLINIKRVAWGVKELEELRGNRPAAGYAPCAVDESLLNELVNRIIGRLSV